MLQTVCSGTAKCMHSLCSEKSLLFTLLQYEYNEALSPSFRPAVYRLQKKDTNTGTLISINIPWNIAIGITSFPEYWVMEGRSTSIELTPAADIGASLPKYFRMSGAPSKAIISRKILASRAMVPSSVASCRPMEGSFELRNQNGGKRIISKSATHRHAVEHTPLAQQQTGEGGEQQRSH